MGERKLSGKHQRPLSGKSRKTGHMSLKIKDPSVDEFCKWRCTDSYFSGPTGRGAGRNVSPIMKISSSIIEKIQTRMKRRKLNWALAQP